MLDFPEIKSKRLLLRQVTQNDLDNVYKGLSDPEVIRYYEVSFKTREETREQMKWFADLEKNGTGIWWAVCSSNNNSFYGAGGLNNLSKKHKKGSVFNVDVTAVLAKCLFDGLSLAMPYDPFFENDKASRFGEAAILLAQIFEDNEGEIRNFFGISAAQSQIKIKTRNGEFALTEAAGCAGRFGVVRCNRGGTANLIANFEVRMQFQKPRN